MIAQPPLNPRDLAPGDQRSKKFDWTGFRFIEVLTPDDPDFPRLYEALAAVFAPLGEMESAAVLRHRLSWQGKKQENGRHLSYRMLALEKNGIFTAVRDHTIILTPEPKPSACVHLSHVFVAPGWRRTGLAGWMRAFPIRDARQVCHNAGFPKKTPITLVAEMEPLTSTEQLPRLQAYSRAGFRRIAPDLVSYHQPDFRSPAEIDASGGPFPLPFWLMIRRVGAKNGNKISGLELKRLVSALYAMYATGFRPQDMAPLWRELENYPPDDAFIALENLDLLPA